MATPQRGPVPRAISPPTPTARVLPQACVGSSSESFRYDPSHELTYLLCKTLVKRGSIRPISSHEKVLSGTCITYCLAVFTVSPPLCSYIMKTGFSILGRSHHPAVTSSGASSRWSCGWEAHVNGSQSNGIGLSARVSLGPVLSCSFFQSLVFFTRKCGFPSLDPGLPRFTIAQGAHHQFYF